MTNKHSLNSYLYGNKDTVQAVPQDPANQIGLEQAI